MSNGSGFDGADFSEFYNSDDWLRLIQVQKAKQRLNMILLSLNLHLLNHFKSGATQEVKELRQAIRGCNKLILAQVCDEITDIVAGLEAALLATEDQLKSGPMAKLEAWHASKPAFILHLPELRQIVFSK